MILEVVSLELVREKSKLCNRASAIVNEFNLISIVRNREAADNSADLPSNDLFVWMVVLHDDNVVL